MYLDKFKVTGQTAFITGGGRGIGLCAAEALLEAGAKVVISDISADVLAAGQAELAAKGWKVDAVQLDVTDPDAVGHAAAAANERHGAIDILVANAGIAWPDTPGESMSNEVWRKVVDVDLNGVLLVLPRVRPTMLSAAAVPSSPSGRCRAYLQQAAAPGPVQRREGRGAPHHPVAGRGMGRARRARECVAPDLCGHGDVARQLQRARPLPDLDGEHADEAGGAPGRDRVGDPLPRQRSGERDDRLAWSWWIAATPSGEWRSRGAGVANVRQWDGPAAPQQS